jgi:hypothetical protein
VTVEKRVDQLGERDIAAGDGASVELRLDAVWIRSPVLLRGVRMKLES